MKGKQIGRWRASFNLPEECSILGHHALNCSLAHNSTILCVSLASFHGECLPSGLMVRTGVHVRCIGVLPGKGPEEQGILIRAVGG